VPLAIAIPLLGCLGSPVPLPRRDRGTTGEEHKLDLTFLKPGQTSRAQVDQQLGWLDIGYHEPHLFWGRWSSSAMGYWIVVASYNNAATAGGRVWGVHNLVLSFDDQGLLRESHLANEESILRTLHQSLRESGASPLDLSSPLTLDVGHWHSSFATFERTTLVLRPGSLDLQEFSRQLHYAHFTPADVVAVNHSGLTSQSQNREKPENATLTLKLSRDTRMGKKITLRMSPQSLLTLIRYLDQFAPNTLSWE